MRPHRPGISMTKDDRALGRKIGETVAPLFPRSFFVDLIVLEYAGLTRQLQEASLDEGQVQTVK